jgi:Trk K+ transport system NAD-binding subunit
MKFIPAQIATWLGGSEDRRNVSSLVKYVAFVVAVIGVFTVLFHVLMLSVEGQEHSWITGFYWTLTVMTTLGFGDITFHTDVGRIFSIVVLLSGVVLLLIVLPFAFIRLFYAPWMEARIRQRAPRAAPADVTGHVVICAWDAIAPGLVARLRLHGIPYFVVEPDPVVASRMDADGISVVTGEIDASDTYARLQVQRARLVLANREDTTNTNIVLTVREVAPDVPIVAIVENDDSLDVLALAGATHVLPLKRRLGEMLANRINVGHARAHVVGELHGLQVAEFSVHATGFGGKYLRDLSLREGLGINFVGVWERGRLQPVGSDTLLSDASVPVVVGTPEQIRALDELLVIYDTNYHAALVIGGGKVGRAAVATVRGRDFPVTLVERSSDVCGRARALATRVVEGDAADREVLDEAGIAEAPSVLLTTNDDAMNIYLAVYCRRLNRELRIVSRITHERNIEAIHRAGADFVLSYAWLGVEQVFALIRGSTPMLLGEHVELFVEPLPQALDGRTLAESNIGDATGLNVIAIERNGRIDTNPSAATRLERGASLIVVGSGVQLERFRRRFGAPRA